MFARKIYAQVYLHKSLIIHWSILEKEFDEKYFKNLVARNLPDEELMLVTKCFDPDDFPDIEKEDFIKTIISDLAPNWINQWKYNNNYCFIKARSSSVLDEDSVMDVLGYVEHLQNRKKEEM